MSEPNGAGGRERIELRSKSCKKAPTLPSPLALPINSPSSDRNDLTLINLPNATLPVLTATVSIHEAFISLVANFAKARSCAGRSGGDDAYAEVARSRMRRRVRHRSPLSKTGFAVNRQVN